LHVIAEHARGQDISQSANHLMLLSDAILILVDDYPRIGGAHNIAQVTSLQDVEGTLPDCRIVISREFQGKNF
jgi:hypothetical protein